MLVILLIILCVLVLIFIGYLILQYYNIKHITTQLEEIININGTNQRLTTIYHSKLLEKFIININRLIDQHKYNQQALEKQTSRLKQEITNVSHDFRTPLTSIKGFVDLLKNNSLSEEDKEGYIEVIERKIDILSDTVDLFYELSLIDSDDYKVKLKEESLFNIITETILPFYHDFEKKHINVTLDLDAKIPYMLVDKKAMIRIVGNLIQNALRYSKTYFKILLYQQKENIIFQVINDTDTLNSKFINRVFDRTFMMDSSRNNGQSGLGLYIVKELVEKQDGQVSVEFVNNEFIITIKLKNEKLLC